MASGMDMDAKIELFRTCGLQSCVVSIHVGSMVDGTVCGTHSVYTMGNDMSSCTRVFPGSWR
eukprot:7081993-Pyramimonas_sp.AAC.2